MNVKLQELPVEERIKLVEDLWDSIAADRKALPITPEQRAELDHRLKAYEIDKSRDRTAADGPRRRAPAAVSIAVRLAVRLSPDAAF